MANVQQLLAVLLGMATFLAMAEAKSMMPKTNWKGFLTESWKEKNRAGNGGYHSMGKPEPPMMMMPGFKADIGKVMLTKDDDEMNIVVNNNFHGGHGGLMMHGGFKHHDHHHHHHHHHHQKTKYFVASGHEDTCMVKADKQIMEGNPMQDACMKAGPGEEVCLCIMKPEYYDEMMEGHDKEHDDGNMEGHDKEYHDDKMGGHDDHEHKMMDKEEEKDIKKSGDDHDHGHDHEEGMEHEGKEMMKDMKKQEKMMKPSIYMRTCGKCQDPCALKFIPKHDPSHDHEDHHMIMHLTGQPHVHAMRPSSMMGMYKPMPMMIPPMPNYMMKQKPGMTSSMRSKMPGMLDMMMGHGKKDKIVPGIDILIRPAKTGIMMGEGMMNMKMMD